MVVHYDIIITSPTYRAVYDLISLIPTFSSCEDLIHILLYMIKLFSISLEVKHHTMCVQNEMVEEGINFYRATCACV